MKMPVLEDGSAFVGSELAEVEGMVLVPGGPFEMGSTDGGEFERPVHTVDLDPFWMDATPVVNRAFREFVEATGYQTTAEREGAAWGYKEGKYRKVARLSWRSYATPDRDEHPVILVSWDDAAAFTAWCGKALPTEAQWEKAARGDLSGRQYPWGDTDPDGSQCNFTRPAGETPGTAETKAFPPNGYGLFDMVGNVWQWCRDWYGASYYAESPAADPVGPSEGETRIRRGGAWNVIQPFRLRVSNRGALPPHSIAPNLGFRCVLVLKGDRAWSAQAATESGAADARSAVDGLATPGEVTCREVEQVLDSLRLAMEADGGGVRLIEVRGRTVVVEFSGSCLYCPSQSLTLEAGLTRSLRAALPWVDRVERSS
jgi:formylglycine-generating enzyme required for sulfatase activity/Fe-S cluster biogenesis protein NfuA